MNNRSSEFDNLVENIEKEIYAVAEKAGLKNESLWPVTDGICSSELWSASPLKILWCLKEAYDDFVDGKPAGGGWSILSKDSLKEL